MTDWATCLQCSEPVIGARRLEARLCSPACLEDGLRELQQLDAQLDLTRFSTDAEGRVTSATGGVTKVHRRSLLLHAIGAWSQRDGEALDAAIGTIVAGAPTAPTPRA